MARARPIFLVSAVVVASATLLAACGSDDDTAASSAVVTDPAGSAAITTDAVTTDAVTTDAPVESTADTVAPTDTTAPETVPPTDAPPAGTPEVTEARVGTVIDVATAAGTFNTLLAAIDAVGLTEQIATGKYTLLAPTDETFAALGRPALDALMADPAALLALVNNHVLPGPEDVHTIGLFNNVVTLGNGSLTVTTEGDLVMVDGATITSPDIAADNGFIHVINKVLVPAAA